MPLTTNPTMPCKMIPTPDVCENCGNRKGTCAPCRYSPDQNQPHIKTKKASDEEEVDESS